MTGGFHTYIYTDCRADEGLQHRDGFQFQAVSHDADRTAMPVIQRNLLYEPSPQWMRERRPVSDYPPSLAHVYDAGGLYATAAGVYLGRESRGGREGNQLTHAAATHEASSYGLVRPAQMFGAPFWTTVPAPTLECPALESGWSPGPFGVPQARSFVTSQPGGVDFLADLLTELRRSEGQRPRILFIAHEPEKVLRWITAATILLPQSQALRVSFKVFTHNPAYADHRILAVQPGSTSGSISIDNESGYVVFDLVRNRRSQVRTDPGSRRWVELFVTEDPYDITDAVEVAAASGLDGPDATAFALATVLDRPPGPAHIRPLVSWLDTGDATLLRRYGPRLVDQLLASATRWSAEDLGRLDAATSARVPERAAPVRLRQLRVELAAVLADGLVRPGLLLPLGAPDGPDPARAEVTELLVDALRRASPKQFEALLRLAYRFRCTPPLDQLEPGLGRFVEDWATHPDAPYLRSDWAAGDGVRQRLRAMLDKRLAELPSRADEIGDAWWTVLVVDTIETRTPLDEVVISTAIKELTGRGRRLLADKFLRAARTAADPVAALEHTAAVLWRRSPPTFADAQQLCSLMPTGMVFDQAAFPRLSDQLLDAFEISDDKFNAAHLMAVSRRVWRCSPKVRVAIANEETVRMIEREVTGEAVEPGMLHASMSSVPARTLAAHQPRLLDALIAAQVAAGALAVLRSAPQLGPAYAERLARRVTDKDWEPAHMAMAFLVSNGAIPEIIGLIRPGFTESLTESVKKLMTRASNGKLESVSRQIDQIGKPWPERFKAIKRRERHGNPLRRIVPRGQ